MKALKNNAYDLNTWNQVISKIKYSDYDKQNENRDFIERVRAAQSSKSENKTDLSTEKK